MDEKISLDAVNLYAGAYAEKVQSEFFSKKQKITGPEILSLCNIQQINLFIVKELFQAWKKETEHLKSPYFDFDNAEVSDALENLMSILSKNIAVSAPDFFPLLKRAVTQTLLVIFDPYDFFSMLITGHNQTLSLASFRAEIKYLKINRAPLERMLQKFEEKNMTEISGNEAFAILDQILEEVNFTPQDVDDYIRKFSSVLLLDPSSFYVNKGNSYNAPAPTSPERRATAHQPIKTNQPKINAPSNQPRASIQDRSQNDSSRPTIAQNYQKISRIKDSLTINQKFMFTKVLFHGDFELFSKAIDRLDQFDSLKNALRYIEEEYSSTWDHDSEEFHEFMELIEKRFA